VTKETIRVLSFCKCSAAGVFLPIAGFSRRKKEFFASIEDAKRLQYSLNPLFDPDSQSGRAEQ
jgi:hypothetical protein